MERKKAEVETYDPLMYIMLLSRELERHDWYHEYSDDHSVWQAGMKHKKECNRLFNKVCETSDRQTAVEIWNLRCPKRFKIQ